jgi:hypothetical protein
MIGWGPGAWGISPWSGLTEITAGAPPSIVVRIPAPNEINIDANASVTVAFFDPDVDLDTATALIEANGEVAYSGGTGFSPGYIGVVDFFEGVLKVQFIKVGGWGFDTQVEIHASISDISSMSVDDTWTWNTALNPICYTGLSPIPIEIAIQTPLVNFVELDQIRRLLFDSVLRSNGSAITNRGNKAARVIYQVANDTELRTTLNTFVPRNEAALKTTVCEKERLLVVYDKLSKFDKILQQGIQSLVNKDLITPAYIGSFMDYFDSTLFKYKVSLAANLILVAKSIELKNG